MYALLKIANLTNHYTCKDYGGLYVAVILPLAPLAVDGIIPTRGLAK